MTPNSIAAYPLAWPAGWPRARDRKGAKFSTGGTIYRADAPSYRASRELSVADGTHRVLYELERLGVGHGDAIISTNLVLRLDGLPRSDQRAPEDPGRRRLLAKERAGTDARDGDRPLYPGGR